MKAEIIAVGTEILLGDIVNTNAQFISKGLAEIGVDVYRQEVVGDNQDRLLEIFNEALSRSDIVITTGGLGPTNDDLTKETACKFFGMDVEIHQESLKQLENYFKRIEREMVPSNLKQVYFPKEAIVLPNPNGTAPGAILQKDDKTIIVLPGPPKEMKPMFINYVKPFLSSDDNDVIVSEIIRVLGIGESTAAEKLKDLVEESVNPTVAPYAKDEDVIFRVTAKAKNNEQAKELINPIKAEIKKRFGIKYYAEGEVTIEQVVCSLLLDRNLKIATAESCTGGMIASRLVSCAGISEAFLEGAVTYSNDAKVRTLKVKQDTLDKFGAVSEETADEMARGIANRAGADISVVTTGIAGPGGGTDKKPVGLVYIGVYYKGEVDVHRYVFNGNRANVRLRATITALDLVRRKILLNNN